MILNYIYIIHIMEPMNLMQREETYISQCGGENLKFENTNLMNHTYYNLIIHNNNNNNKVIFKLTEETKMIHMMDGI